MTAIAIRNNSISTAAEFGFVKKFRLPIPGVVSLKLYGGDKARTERNFVTGFAEDGVVGSPVYGDYFTAFSEANYLQTSVQDTADLTVVTVCRVPAYVSGNRALLLTNSGSVGTNYPPGSSNGNIEGRGLFLDFTATLAPQQWERARIDPSNARGNTNIGTVVSSGNLAAADAGTPQCLVGRSRAVDRLVRIDNKTKGTGTSATLASDIATAGPWTVGSSPLHSGTTGAAVDIYAQMFFARYASDAEVTDATNWLRALYNGIITF